MHVVLCLELLDVRGHVQACFRHCKYLPHFLGFSRIFVSLFNAHIRSSWISTPTETRLRPKRHPKRHPRRRRERSSLGTNNNVQLTKELEMMECYSPGHCRRDVGKINRSALFLEAVKGDESRPSIRNVIGRYRSLNGVVELIVPDPSAIWRSGE